MNDQEIIGDSAPSPGSGKGWAQGLFFEEYLALWVGIFGMRDQSSRLPLNTNSRLYPGPFR